MVGEREARRLIQVTDVDEGGRRHPVLVTGDPAVVAAVEKAVRERVGERLDPSSTGDEDGER